MGRIRDIVRIVAMADLSFAVVNQQVAAVTFCRISRLVDCPLLGVKRLGNPPRVGPTCHPIIAVGDNMNIF